MSDPMKNKDRDEKHCRRRRGLGEGEDDLDGRAVAAALYGGPDSSRDEPRCENCGKPIGENADVGCAKCDPRARRGGAPGPIPTSPNQNE